MDSLPFTDSQPHFAPQGKCPSFESFGKMYLSCFCSDEKVLTSGSFSQDHMHSTWCSGHSYLGELTYTDWVDLDHQNKNTMSWNICILLFLQGIYICIYLPYTLKQITSHDLKSYVTQSVIPRPTGVSSRVTELLMISKGPFQLNCSILCFCYRSLAWRRHSYSVQALVPTTSISSNINLQPSRQKPTGYDVILGDWRYSFKSLSTRDGTPIYNSEFEEAGHLLIC